MEVGTALGRLFWGHILLLVCSAFYLSWWYRAFRPSGAVTGWVTSLLLLGTLLSAVLAIFLLLTGILWPGTGSTAFPVPLILAGGVILYIVLLVISGKFYNRPVTSELLFIVLWLALELSVMAVLQRDGLAAGLVTTGLCAVLSVFLINMLCYMVYYHLPEYTSFLVGMLPLGLAGILAFVLAVMTRLV